MSSPVLLPARFTWKKTALAAAILAGTGLFLMACTSESPPDAAADSTGTSSTASAAKTPSSEPAAPTSDQKASETRSVAEKLEDARVETRVKKALMEASSLRIFPFRPTVRAGHLFLRGDVNTPEQYRRAERIAERVAGVDTLTNQLTMGGRPVTAARLAGDDSTETAEENPSVYHTVDEGDTLWKIAQEYRTSIEQLRRLNDLRSDGISPGQRIRVR